MTLRGIATANFGKKFLKINIELLECSFNLGRSASLPGKIGGKYMFRAVYIRDGVTLRRRCGFRVEGS